MTTPRAEPSNTTDHKQPSRLWPVLWLVWLPFLAWPIARLLRDQPSVSRTGAVLAGVVGFVAVYIWAAFRNDISRPSAQAHVAGQAWVPFVALAGGAVAVVFSNGPEWLLLFIYASAIGGARRPRRMAALAVVAAMVLAVGAGLLTGALLPALGQTLFLVAAVGGLVVGLGWSPSTGRDGRREAGAGEVAHAGGAGAIRTPDKRLRVFISSTLEELASEREAAQAAVTGLHLTPVLFELGARPHPPRALYQAYLQQSDVFIGIYWQRYGWVAPNMHVSGLEDEYGSAAHKPKLVYIKRPAPDPEPRLVALLERIRDENAASYKSFATTGQLQELIENDLALLLSEGFATARIRRGDSA